MGCTASLLQAMSSTDYAASFILRKSAVIDKRKTVQQRTAEGTATRVNNGRIEMDQSELTIVIIMVPRNQPHHVKKISSKQSKRRDLCSN